jgi:hypothetical protein
MALSLNTVLEVRQVGADTNGGGFVTGASGTDWSQQTSAQYTLTGLTSSGAGNTLLTASASADMVGNIAYSVSGTNQTTGTGAVPFFQITSVSVGVSITFSTNSAGTSIATGIVAAGAVNIGGALGTPGQAAAILTVAGMRAWVKYSSTAYNMTTATAGLSGGPVVMGTNGTSIEGYDQTRGDRTGNRPVVSWAGVASPGSGTTYIFQLTGTGLQSLANIIANGNTVANVGGVSVTNASGTLSQCIAENCSGTLGIGINLGGANNRGALQCAALTCLTGFQGGFLVGCYATGCTTGFTIGFGVKCLAYANTTGFLTMNSCDQCTADSNTTAGFSLSNSSLFNCIASNSTGTGIVAGTNTGVIRNCAVYNNGTHVSGTALINEGQITLTVNPYVTALSDFRPNSAAGGGAALRNAGIGVYGQTDNCDVSAVQHTDPSGSGGYVPRTFQVGC